MQEAAEMWRQQQESGGNVPDGDRPHILVKEVEQDGKIVLAVSGQSTLPQTIVNSTKSETPDLFSYISSTNPLANYWSSAS